MPARLGFWGRLGLPPKCSRGSSSTWFLKWLPKDICSIQTIVDDEWRAPKWCKTRCVGALRQGNEAAMVATINSKPHNKSPFTAIRTIPWSSKFPRNMKSLKAAKIVAKRPVAIRKPMRIFSLIGRCIFIINARGISEIIRSKAMLKTVKC